MNSFESIDSLADNNRPIISKLQFRTPIMR